MEKYTLVPKEFFNGDVQLLSQVVGVSPSETVKYVELPSYEAVLLFVPGDEGKEPVIYDLLCDLQKIHDYNKVLFCIDASSLHLAIGAGDRLLLANSYEAKDFTTALYFIFAALNDFQINPRMTTLYYKGDLAYDNQELLFSYFKGVERLCV
ncbi:MAG: DUF3822 family protein [Bacteroidales bacterium]|nr:DUF3822 family protein [Bacteroidales bacterium]MBO7584865.1 DUF3822 family protein [Bacteroidales bacterium]